MFVHKSDAWVRVCAHHLRYVFSDLVQTHFVFPPSHLCFCAHLCVLCINYFWTIRNVENRTLKFVVSEITFYWWMSALKKSGVTMAPREVCRLRHVLAFLVLTAGLVCGFALSLHPVLKQLVLCKLVHLVWAPLGKQWSWYVCHGLNCV
jgi:hypothetical protein